MEEKRSIKVSLEKAIEWYNSGNEALRTLALTAYTENELIPDFNYISSRVGQRTFCTKVSINDAKKYSTLVDLIIIAKYFNGDWVKTANNIGYFLSKHNPYCKNSVIATCNDTDVYKHSTVQYAGVVYFKNKEDAIKAVKILGDRVKNLF